MSKLDLSAIETLSPYRHWPAAHWCDIIADKGYLIIPDFLEAREANALYNYANALPESQWHLAGIGRNHQHTVNTHIRGDRIHWMHASVAEEKPWLNAMETLRTHINRELFMGLFDYECHLARYPEGAFYKKHLDAFKGRSNRILTTVFYLNPEWEAKDGGQLVIYGKQGEVLETVLPQQNTLVIFLADTFVHEVLPGHRERFSLTGWFRHNTTNAAVVDPPQ